MLSRNLNDGTANFPGLSSDAVTYLGSADLVINGISLQGVLGAAVDRTFDGSTGRKW